jgi:hypothetical protein
MSNTTIRFGTAQQKIMEHRLESDAILDTLTCEPQADGRTYTREEVSAAVNRCYTHLKKGVNTLTCELIDLEALFDSIDGSTAMDDPYDAAEDWGGTYFGWERTFKLLRQKKEALRAAIKARIPNWTPDPSEGQHYPVIVRSAWLTEADVQMALDSGANEPQIASLNQKLEHLDRNTEATALWLTGSDIQVLNEQLSWYHYHYHACAQDAWDRPLWWYSRSNFYGRCRKQLVEAAALAGYTEKIEERY